jgi:hypothetical protein
MDLFSLKYPQNYFKITCSINSLHDKIIELGWKPACKLKTKLSPLMAMRGRASNQ